VWDKPRDRSLREEARHELLPRRAGSGYVIEGAARALDRRARYEAPTQRAR
jgi:hypothetical protein